MIKRISLHKINDSKNFTFRPDEYSRFKFGDDKISEKFGTQLADFFIKEHSSQINDNEELVVISSPYSFIPTATFAMKTHFVNQLNQWLYQNDLKVVSETKVNRTVTYKIDYGNLTAEERLQLIEHDQLHIDNEFIKNKTLVFLDDIRITGSHEKIILKMIEKYKLKNKIILIYFAELVDNNIHPNIENYLNYFSVKVLTDLIPIIESNHFFINTRIVKFILNNKSDKFIEFVKNRPNSFIKSLYYMAIGNGYHTIEEYQKNIYLLKNMI